VFPAGAAAKKAYVEAVAPYRDACRKAGVECEFAGARAANKSPAVRFRRYQDKRR
jgi:hypothetical protein